MYKMLFCIIVGIVLCVSGLAKAQSAGLVVEDPDQLMGFEPQMLAQLQSLGYTVELIRGDDVKNEVFTMADAEALDVMVVSEAISSSDMNPLVGVDVPMMHGEGYGWHKMNFAEDGTQGWQDATGLADVVNDTHPIVAAAGLSVGTMDFLMHENATTTTAQVSVLAPGAVSLVSMVVNGNEFALVFAIDKGAELAKGAGPATNRIVGFSLPGNQEGVLSDDGWALFDAAIAWLDAVDAPKAGLVVEDPDQLMGFEPQMLAQLQSLGYTVELIRGDDVKNEVFTMADAEALDVMVVSEAISSSDMNPLVGVDVPMMHGEGYGWHKMNFAEDGTQGWQDATGLADVVNDTHPIVAAAGLSVGAIDFLMHENATTTTAQVSVLAPGAVSLVSMVVDGNEFALVFAIDKGAELAKGAGPATNRIVGFSLPGNQEGVLSDDGWALFDAAIAWLDPAPTPIPSMVAHWPMDEGEGTLVADVVGGNDGTMVGLDPATAWIDGALGGAVSFDGIDGHNIAVLDSAELDFGDVDFSISLMVRYPSIPTTEHRLICKGTFGSPNTGSRYDLYLKGSELRFEIDNGPANVKSSLKVANAPFVTGEWVHVVAVRDSVNDELLLYADGILQGSATETSGDISNGEWMRIGASTNDDSTMMGDIDDVRIFPTALTEDDIAAIASLY